MEEKPDRPPGLSRRGFIAASAFAATALSVQQLASGTAAMAAPLPAAGGYVYPTNPFIVNNHPSTWYGAPRPGGRTHAGVDCQGSRGQAIYAIAGGVVIGGEWASDGSDNHGYGNNVWIDHENGVRSRYAHLNGAPSVGMGARIASGQQIGGMGNSQKGATSGLAVHLHLEIQVNGGFVDPKAFLETGSVPAPEAQANPDPGFEGKDDDMYKIVHGANDNKIYLVGISGERVHITQPYHVQLLQRLRAEDSLLTAEMDICRSYMMQVNPGV